jgi:hypothetical protein
MKERWTVDRFDDIEKRDLRRSPPERKPSRRSLLGNKNPLPGEVLHDLPQEMVRNLQGAGQLLDVGPFFPRLEREIEDRLERVLTMSAEDQTHDLFQIL